MPTLGEARQELANIVTAAGLHCEAYPPDAIVAPLAFVDDIGVDFTGGTGGGGFFCLPGAAVATIVTLAQRNDRPGSMAYLEGLSAGVIEGLYTRGGIRVLSAASGQLNVGGQDLPSITYTVQFLI